MSSSSDAVDSLVKSLFKVNDTFQLPEGEYEYRVTYDAGSKGNFEKLYAALDEQGLRPWLTGTREDCVLTVRKKLPPRALRSRIPLILGLLTLASVAVFALIEEETYAKFAPAIPWYLVFVSYGGFVGSILAVHELGHRYVSRRKGTSPPTPYVIPGVPTLTSVLPALGIISPQKEPAMNRDHIFDIMIAGPLAALTVAVILYVAGELTTFQSVLPTQGVQTVNSYISVGRINPSAIQYALDTLLSPFAPSAAAGFMRLSPASDAATAGFMLTFVGLLPIAFLDGGYLSAAVLGGRVTRIATYLAVLALIVFDTPNYWALAIVVLVMAGRPFDIQTCDEISGISDTRKALFLIAVVIAFLSLPIPQNIATIPLG
jgi:membrane-associated protease RseP (regulator of RpoE activity)